MYDKMYLHNPTIPLVFIGLIRNYYVLPKRYVNFRESVYFIFFLLSYSAMNIKIHCYYKKELRRFKNPVLTTEYREFWNLVSILA